MSNVRVRFAPSPTGTPHVGNIRTALYNFLFAKNQKGQFILRIEDTDRERFQNSAIEEIKKSLLVLGLKWDKYYQQSKRLPLYNNALEKLKNSGEAYPDEGAWRFKVKSGIKISWQDIVHQNVEFNSDVIEDFVIVKKDGFPTYHFASVIDDHYMQISHVIRGDEWISSTPKHLLIYSSLLWKPPMYVHIPPILGMDKKKLSKREGAISVFEYVNKGYLPEAVVNFLALLGWSPSPPEALSEGGKREKEIFSLDELIRIFSLERLNKNSPVFNLEKLNWFNKKYINVYPKSKLLTKIKNFSKLAQKADNKKLAKIVDLLEDRLVMLGDFDKFAGIFFKKGFLPPPPRSKSKLVKEAIDSVRKWNEFGITKTLDEWISRNRLDSSDIKNILRLSVFADNTPPIYQSLAVLPKAEVRRRIDDAIQKAK